MREQRGGRLLPGGRYAQERVTEAAEYLQEAVRVNALHHGSWFMLGVIGLREQRYEMATKREEETRTACVLHERRRRDLRQLDQEVERPVVVLFRELQRAGDGRVGHELLRLVHVALLSLLGRGRGWRDGEDGGSGRCDRHAVEREASREGIVHVCTGFWVEELAGVREAPGAGRITYRLPR